MTKVRAVVNGAISVVNAIATGRGATLGISLKVSAVVETHHGKGLEIFSKNHNLSSRLINRTVEKIIPKKEFEKNKIRITLESEIPTGYGLKSSSAISSAVALACAKIFKPKFTDQQILIAGADASIETKVSITGAYDDACGCYYGGFNVTDNLKRKLIRRERAPGNLIAVIFIPKNRKRGNIKNLKYLDSIFEKAWHLARKSEYWDAMIINGLATATLLNSDPKIITDLIKKRAISATVSGNGPSIAAVTKKENVSNIKKVFSSLDGRILISNVNNKKAEVYEL